DRALKASGLCAYFHASRCADECFSKPHPEMLFQLVHALGANPARTLMIGDTTHDVQMAANASVPMLAVGYGAHPKDTLLALNPLDCIDRLSEFKSWLAAKGYPRKPS
ncbi:MAG TPA: HAD-IA family hydrolase, partial [Burkholderiales bacterium]|nr:HAD-IA family hydrolase [Burkholderiales bacterium]